LPTTVVVDEIIGTEELTLMINNAITNPDYPFYISHDGYVGLNITLKNNTNSVMRIIWENSSISDSAGSHGIFLSGQRYATAGNANPPLILPPRDENLTSVYSADCVEFVANNWRMNNMSGNSFKLTICYSVDDKEEYISYQIAVSE
jgi:hypothetical protein